jgi:hypothetical protein
MTKVPETLRWSASRSVGAGVEEEPEVGDGVALHGSDGAGVGEELEAVDESRHPPLLRRPARPSQGRARSRVSNWSRVEAGSKMESGGFGRRW